MNYGSQRLSLPLGDVLALNREPVRVDPTAEYPNFGLYSFGRGAFEKPPISGTNTSAPTLYRVRAGQFIYSRLFAFEEAFGVVPPRMDGWYVSNEYPTFDVHDWQATVEFIRLVICRPSTWEELAAMTVGMGHRRQRLRPEDLMSFEIDLPPLEEQRAICELNDAAIDACEAIQAERDAATILAASLREHHLLKRAETVPVGELLKGIDSGTSPRCLERPPAAGEWGVLKTSSVRPGEFRPSEAKALPPDACPATRAEIRTGDVLTIRASGSRRLVGAVCRAADDVPCRLLMGDYHWRLEVDETQIDPDYFVEAMALSETRRQIEDATVGSTSAGKISQASLATIEIPVPSLERQRRFLGLARPVHEVLAGCTAEAAAAEQLRISLIEELLGHELSHRFKGGIA